MMIINKQSSQVVFFLGAGASVAAGVPDTYSFVNEFIENIADKEKQKTIKKIVQTLKNWKNSDIDIELLLETLTKLENKEQEPLLRFYEGGNFILRGYYEKNPIIDDLKDFIKSKAIVSEEKIQYLQPFLGFVEEFRPLDIISVNYDTCMEQFCNVHKLSYQDGFDVYWNPKAFDTENTDIRLYKLHGSVMWYQSDRGDYIKLPVMTGRSNIQLITGETAENLMLYPMQKWDYAEPLLELLVHIKYILESETCKFLIVVGYSFRDKHIRKILWDSARKNKQFNIILVDPNAYQIYQEKLKYYEGRNRIPSSLYGRILCLPYKFQNVFPYLKNYYLKNLREAIISETTQKQIEMKGEKPDWLSPLRLFINSEHTEKVENLSDRMEGFELERDWQLSLELPLKMAVNLSFNNQGEKANQYLKDFSKTLRLMIIERINVNVLIEPPIIEINFNYTRHDKGGSFIGIGHFKKGVEALSEFCETRMMCVDEPRDDLRIITGKLKKLKRYFDQFKEEKIDIEDYINLRESKMMPDVEIFRETYKRFKEGYSEALRERLILLAIQIEKSILQEIINEE